MRTLETMNRRSPTRSACVLEKRWSQPPPPHRVPIKGRCPIGAHYHGPTGGRGGASPPIAAPPEGRGCLIVAVLLEGRGCLIVMVDDKGPDDEGPIPSLVSSLPFFFF
jgi:hypothetical protein